jgi:hypothetical protein
MTCKYEFTPTLIVLTGFGGTQYELYSQCVGKILAYSPVNVVGKIVHYNKPKLLNKIKDKMIVGF